MKAWLSGKKTYILVGLGVLAMVVQFLAGDITLMEFLQSEQFLTLLGLLGIGTLRAGVAKSGGAASVALFLFLGSGFLSPVVAQTQTGEAATGYYETGQREWQNLNTEPAPPDPVVYESKTLFEPDYTVGLVTIASKTDGDGITADIIPGIGIGIAYSSVSSSDGVEWDVTNWSVAVDPLYVERDLSGSLFWVPGIKGAVFNDYLQVYLGYKVGSLPDGADRWNVKFGTSLTGIWDGLTGAVGL